MRNQLGKRRTDLFAETDDDVDILAMPLIEPSTRYPPKAKEPEILKELPTTAPPDPEEVAEREARSKRVAEMVQKQILMAGLAPAHHVASLVDVIDETGELCYIDDSTLMEMSKTHLPALTSEKNKIMDKDVNEETPEEGQALA